MAGHKPFKSLTDKMSDESKARVAALTRDADEAIRARATRDPEFFAALVAASREFEEGGESETAQGLRDYLRLRIADDTEHAIALAEVERLVNDPTLT
jgi:hypothetical protein